MSENAKLLSSDPSSVLVFHVCIHDENPCQNGLVKRFARSPTVAQLPANPGHLHVNVL